jgi:hypothetical protein
LYYLDSDAGEARTGLTTDLAVEFPELESEMVGSINDGFTMFEYWVNKDIIEQYTSVYIARLSDIT